MARYLQPGWAGVDGRGGVTTTRFESTVLPHARLVDGVPGLVAAQCSDSDAAEPPLDRNQRPDQSHYYANGTAADGPGGLALRVSIEAPSEAAAAARLAALTAPSLGGEGAIIVVGQQWRCGSGMLHGKRDIPGYLRVVGTPAVLGASDLDQANTRRRTVTTSSTSGRGHMRSSMSAGAEDEVAEGAGDGVHTYTWAIPVVRVSPVECFWDVALAVKRYPSVPAYLHAAATGTCVALHCTALWPCWLCPE
jgi:hypothetical protein